MYDDDSASRITRDEVGALHVVNDLSANRDFYLTPRQKEVFGYANKGLRPKQIAYVMNISEATVREHIRKVIECFGVSGLIEALYVARCFGFVADRDT